jgi:UrcA family protein
MTTYNKAKIGRVSAAVLLAAAFGTMMPMASFANEPATQTQKVQVSDLNLSKAKDQRKLERRTTAAIDQVCPERGSAVGGTPAASRAAYRKCAQTARADVQRQLATQRVATRTESEE